MTFTVTYRDKSGAMVEMALEAAGRAECFAECKARGIAPLSVREGKFVKTREPQIGRDSARSVLGKPWCIAILVAAVLAVVGGAWWWFARTEEPPTKKVAAATAKPSAEKPSAKPKREARATVRTPTATNVATVTAKAQQQGAVRTAEEKGQPTTTNKVVKMSPEDEAAFERVKRETSLRTQVENRMALLATIKPGMPVPPMPPIPNLEQDFEKAEANVITITEGDTEKDLERKEFVIQLKERISAAKKEGKTATEALNEYVEAMREVADFRQKSLLAARQMERDGDAAAAAKLVDEANAQLKEIGAEPIDLHPAPKGKKKKSN